MIITSVVTVMVNIYIVKSSSSKIKKDEIASKASVGFVEGKIEDVNKKINDNDIKVCKAIEIVHHRIESKSKESKEYVKDKTIDIQKELTLRFEMSQQMQEEMHATIDMIHKQLNILIKKKS